MLGMYEMDEVLLNELLEIKILLLGVIVLFG